MATDGKKPDLTLVLGGKPGGESAAPSEEGGDRRALAGKALFAALKRQDGAGIMDALEEALDVIDGDLEEEEPEMTDEPTENPFG